MRAALWAFCFIELHSFYPIKIDPLILTTYVWNSAVAKSTHPKTCVVVAFCEVACYENIHKYMQHLPLSALVSRIPCSVAGPRLLHHKKAWDHNGSGAFPDCVKWCHKACCSKVGKCNPLRYNRHWWTIVTVVKWMLLYSQTVRWYLLFVKIPPTASFAEVVARVAWRPLRTAANAFTITWPSL